MHRWFVVLPLVVVAAACSQRVVVANSGDAVDINSAARQAQGDIDTYRANSLQTPAEAAASRALLAPRRAPPASSSAPPLAPPAPGAPGGLADDGTPVSEAPFTAQSAQGAANVVQTYYALIEAGDYAQARDLWAQQGAASGMSPAAFAASFAAYADYHANIGAPGPIDAGAGQRFVTVPVQVYGHLKAGGQPFALRGSVSLHRTADIDGATPEQQSWRISAIALKPAPGAKTPAQDDAASPPLGPIDQTLDDATPATAQADYHCDDGYAFHIAFDNRADTGAVSVGGKQVVVLEAQRVGSGIHYAGGGYDLRGKGNRADFTRPGRAAVTCSAD